MNWCCSCAGYEPYQVSPIKFASDPQASIGDASWDKPRSLCAGTAQEAWGSPRGSLMEQVSPVGWSPGRIALSVVVWFAVNIALDTLTVPPSVM